MSEMCGINQMILSAFSGLKVIDSYYCADDDILPGSSTLVKIVYGDKKRLVSLI